MSCKTGNLIEHENNGIDVYVTAWTFSIMCSGIPVPSGRIDYSSTLFLCLFTSELSNKINT